MPTSPISSEMGGDGLAVPDERMGGQDKNQVCRMKAVSRGAKKGSHHRQMPGEAWRRSATISPASWLFRRRLVPHSDVGLCLTSEGFVGPNPTAPTDRSARMLIAVPIC